MIITVKRYCKNVEGESFLELLSHGPKLAGGNLKQHDDVITAVDFHSTKNSIEHHTERYKISTREQNPALVLRRGKQFQLSITFNRRLNNELKLNLVFETGNFNEFLRFGQIKFTDLL